MQKNLCFFAEKALNRAGIFVKKIGWILLFLVTRQLGNKIRAKKNLILLHKESSYFVSQKTIGVKGNYS
jgi:hypothetical protein